MPIIDKIINFKIPKWGKYANSFDKYKVNDNDKMIKIKQSDLVDIVKSEKGTKIECICDNCGKYFTRRLGLLKKNLVFCQTCLTKHTNRVKYGADVPIQNKEIYKKIKNTTIQKYGADNPMKNKDVVKKAQNTCLQKYGVKYPSQNKKIQEKIKNVFLEKYGVECSLQNETIKEKSKQTLLKNYGVDNSMKSDFIKEKARKTTRKKYGVDYAMQNETVKNKLKDTMLKKYGVEYCSQNETIKEKTKETMRKKYGVDYATQNKSILKKIEQTNLKKYGYKHPLDLAKNRGCARFGHAPCSKNQEHIAKLIGGKINVPVGKYSLDIVKNNVDIEYDGGGHKLNVKFGILTEQEFNNLENLRNETLIKNNYKIIRISCKNDKLPSDDIIIKQINDAIEYLNNNKINKINLMWD